MVRYRLVRQMDAVIGKSLLRREDRALLLGQGQYVADLQLPGMLHVAVVRSMYPHARLDAIQVATLHVQ